MTPIPRALPLLAALALAACEPTPGRPTPPGGAPDPGPALPDPSEDTCGASDLAGLIGQDAGVLDAARFANPVRVIRPGDLVTLDFNPQRLNFELDEAGAIARIRCG